MRTANEQLTRANAHHLLSRFTFGPTLRSLESVERVSAADWLAWQLEPDAIDDSWAESQLHPYRSVLLPPKELRRRYLKAVRRKAPQNRVIQVQKVDGPRLISHAQLVQYTRQLISSRQLLEVMVDFWFNHFNVYARKERTQLFVTDYIENAIRPHALGRFEDLLLATARHPAMLTYLDNYKSSVSQANTEPGKRAGGGITENYARELLELHTLGLHGGYTPADVVEVARIFTGWTLADVQKHDYSFAFKPKLHDSGAKTVLGTRFAAGGDQAEGERLLELLARHPSTARHIAGKLCARFVADNPPLSCVNRVFEVFQRTHGDISAMLVSLVESDDFWRAENRLSKIKSPLHLMISTYRALGLPIHANKLEDWGNWLGQPLLLQPAPTGYPLSGNAWLSTANSVVRMRFANSIGAQAFEELAQDEAEGDARFIERVQQQILTGPVSKETEAVIRSQLDQTPKSDEKRKLAVALSLGSPEFQHF